MAGGAVGRVDIAKFNESVNSYNTIVGQLETQISNLISSGNKLRNAIIGEEADIQALYRGVSTAQTNVQANLQQIKKVIQLIQTTHEAYVQRLDILE